MEVRISQRGSRSPHNMQNTNFMRGNYIHISFHKNCLVFFADCLLGFVKAVEICAFIIEQCLRGVDIFCRTIDLR
ncbi:MAG: hypothetical protein UW24_C0012G0028 [Parcubacteria group bacterium GW2011_GWA2_44_12]|nr:MAG: hypothetical protein UW24_C0012G0028 [Parcubacteria group bacterium GW2011_GWA2_44_12]